MNYCGNLVKSRPPDRRSGHKKACKQAKKERASAAAVEPTPAAQTKGVKGEDLVAGCGKEGTMASSATDAKACAYCQTAPAPLLCTGCHQAWYCSLACQRDAWCVFGGHAIGSVSTVGGFNLLKAPPLCFYRTGHKATCKTVRKAREQAERDVGLSKAANEFNTASHPPTSPAEICDQCATVAAALLVCTGCHQARYCSTECQHASW